MRSANTFLLFVFLVGTFGIWGCTDTNSSPRATARLRHLQTRNTRLEEDYQATVEECVLLRKQLTELRRQHKVLAQRCQHHDEQIQTVRTQRDAYRQQLSVSTSQCDDLQKQLVQFSQALQVLAGKVQQVASNNSSQRVLASTVSMSTSE